MTAYETCKILIKSGRYQKEDMQKKLDVFLAMDRINVEQYKELVELMG